MGADTAHLTGCGPEEKPQTKREKQAEFQKQYDALGFNAYLLGDEVITHLRKDGKIEIRYRKQLSRDESKIMTFIFDNQTQVERLLPSIMKGLKTCS